MERRNEARPPPTLVEFEEPLPVRGGRATSATQGKSSRGDAQVEEVLNSILPPRMWDQEDGSAWMQYVSKAPCGRNEVLTLQQKLEERLTQRQARESGICPVREDLYAQCFDELIRQVTLASPERGMLLMRVRDEARMTIDAYKTLYESSVTFGVRKQLEAEEGVPEMEEEINELQSTKKDLQERVLALRNQLEVMEKRSTERKQLDQAARKEAVDFLRHQNKHLEHFLRSLPGGGGRA